MARVDSTYVGAHASHVAGTIAAAGVNPAACGMANAVRIDAYSRANDLSEMTSRAATGPDQQSTHIYLSNHSYGSISGWSGNIWFGDGTDANAAEYGFGRYESFTRNLDTLVSHAPYYLVFWSAGNERTDNPEPGTIVRLSPVGEDGTELPAYDPAIHPPGDGIYRNGYETISAEGIAKKIVTVGAIQDAANAGLRDTAMASLTDFSSTGPADDGRIKPDQVANGDSVYSTLVSDAEYGVMSGTSMSSPNACGSAALLVDLYSRLFSGSAMRASTLKGLLIHTADYLGTPGPDYLYGWGLINVRKAADHLIYHDSFPTRQRLTEDELTGMLPLKFHSFEWDGVSPLRATLFWTDPAGLATEVHDSRVPTLVNDLNLKLIAPDGSEYFPYVMPFVGTWTTESMALPATTGVNYTDNVEQIRLNGSAQAGTWQAVVSYVGPPDQRGPGLQPVDFGRGRFPEHRHCPAKPRSSRLGAVPRSRCRTYPQVHSRDLLCRPHRHRSHGQQHPVDAQRREQPRQPQDDRELQPLQYRQCTGPFRAESKFDQQWPLDPPSPA